jgi:hypothetical protein
VKIVKNVVELPSSWGIPPVHAHVYVVHSNNVQRYAEVPTVRINYDILPIIVHVGFLLFQLRTLFSHALQICVSCCWLVSG